MRPKAGDVLVSKDLARVEHTVCVVPESMGSVCANHELAVREALDLAKARGVDAWLTEDHTHFVKLATNRAEG